MIRKERKEKAGTFNNPPQGDMLVGGRGREGKNRWRTETEEKGGENNNAMDWRCKGKVISDLGGSKY